MRSNRNAKKGATHIAPLYLSLASRLPSLPPHRAHAAGRLHLATVLSRHPRIQAGHWALRDAGRSRLTSRVNRLAGDGRSRLVIPVFVHDVALAVAVTTAAGAATAGITDCRSAAGTATGPAAAVAAGIAGDGRPEPHQRAGATAARTDEVCTLIARVAAVGRIADPFAPVPLAAAPAGIAAAVEPVLDAATAFAAGQARTTGGTSAAAGTAIGSAAGMTAGNAAARFANQTVAQGTAGPHATATAGGNKCE